MSSTSPMTGCITVPGDKSISHRALLFSALTRGVSRIEGLAANADVLATRDCLRALGVEITQADDGTYQVQGNPTWQAAPDTLDARNSGTTIRLMSGILAAQPFKTTITGDASLCKRPMGRIINPLRQMGANIQALNGEQFAPLSIQPTPQGLQGIAYELPHASAQVKSAILLAGLYADGDTTVVEPVPSRDHTERMLAHAGIMLNIELLGGGGRKIHLPGGQIANLQAQSWQVPGDVSSAAFWIVAALCTPGSSLRIENVNVNPLRMGLVEVLQRAGGNIRLENPRTLGGEPVADLHVQASQLRGDINIEAAQVPALIDEIPILAVAGLFLDGTLTVRGAEELRKKESDRLAAIAEEFGKLDLPLHLFEEGDGFTLTGNPSLRSNADLAPQRLLDAHHDHRIAMALMTLNRIVTPQRWEMSGSEWVQVSYPGFDRMLFENTLSPHPVPQP